MNWREPAKPSNNETQQVGKTLDPVGIGERLHESAEYEEKIDTQITLINN